MPPLSARRNGLGGARAGQQRPAAPAPAAATRGAGSDRPRSLWSTAVTVYDNWHSAMEAQIIAEFYGAKFGIKLAPIFAERRGTDDSGSGRKYNHDDAAMVVFDLAEAIVLKAQLESFISGQLTEVIVPRLETKRLVLAQSETYYDATHPEYLDHANGLVLAIEEDATDKADGKNVIFISRQQAVTLSADDEPVAFFPEIQAILAVLDSYILNVARVDFASVRLLENRTQEPVAAGPTAPQPVRRGGLTPPASNRAVAASPTTSVASSDGATNITTSNSVTDSDIDAALDSATTDALNDVLGDTPSF